jgi:uncharacterized protein with HEPN domain
MTEMTEKAFIERLLKVSSKLIVIANTQSARFKVKWEEYLKPFNDKPYLIRKLPQPLQKDEFIENIDYRIDVLRLLEQAVDDGFYTIKSLLYTLYNSYFDSDLFKKDFSTDDQVILKYFVAKEILGNLIQYNMMDHDTVPLKYNIIARNYVLMKLQGLNNKEIHSNLKKLQIEISIPEINKLMKEIEKDGLISIHKKGKANIYNVNKELALSQNGEKKFITTGLQSLVTFPTQFWRSFYNIRELNITPVKEFKHRQFLTTVLSKSATQGFSACKYVLTNLIKYFEKIKEEASLS